MVIVVALVATGVISLGGKGPNPADLPPVGTIWFGSTFDPNSFVLSGHTSTVSAGTSVAYVGHLTRSIGSGDANLRISVNGQAFVNQALSIQGSGDVFGSTISGVALSFAGTYTFEVTDLGGNDLASGTLTVQ